MVRQGKWKLVSNYPKNQWELYDIENDRAENTDVAKDNLQIVQTVNAAYLAWAKQNDVTEWNETLASKTGAAFKVN
jgi:arylsulfatase